ncbi:MAG: hypothetical protein E6Q66_10480 [Pedobacter sp.]|nr:MAG: hypothetical protein E6Q66_10480 [Pedobacter sp.]
MRVICKLNDPSNTPSNIPDNFDFGLEIGKQYTVMGMLTFKESGHLYFLVDECSRPSWFPHQLFTISNSQLPKNWFVNINEDRTDVDFHNLIGFYELCNDVDFFNNLLEREEETMRIYFRRKMELEKELAERDSEEDNEALGSKLV